MTDKFGELLEFYLDDAYTKCCQPLDEVENQKLKHAKGQVVAKDAVHSKIDLGLQFEQMLPNYLDQLGAKDNCFTDSETKNRQKSCRRKAEVEQVLDVHGCSISQASQKLDEMLHFCIANKIPKFRLIYGKGIHSFNNLGVLRPALRQQLDNCKSVKKLDPCFPKDGGWGAIWVILNLH